MPKTVKERYEQEIVTKASNKETGEYYLVYLATFFCVDGNYQEWAERKFQGKENEAFSRRVSKRLACAGASIANASYIGQTVVNSTLASSGKLAVTHPAYAKDLREKAAKEIAGRARRNKGLQYLEWCLSAADLYVEEWEAEAQGLSGEAERIRLSRMALDVRLRGY